MDSLAETTSGVVLLWRLWDGEKGGTREQITLKLVGWSLLLLAVYVGVRHGNPDHARRARSELAGDHHSRLALNRHAAAPTEELTESLES